jgi:5-methylcytosine-specific restriction endonuclease McrA
LAWAKRVLTGEEPGRMADGRERIPRSVRHAVWNRDMAKCVKCESNERLEFDHVIPLAMGGNNSERNLQLLCERCNRRKGKSLD